MASMRVSPRASDLIKLTLSATAVAAATSRRFLEFEVSGTTRYSLAFPRLQEGIHHLH